jgi:hypothetical protein
MQKKTDAVGKKRELARRKLPARTETGARERDGSRSEEMTDPRKTNGSRRERRDAGVSISLVPHV